ncbi:MAG: hypothetical protein RL456_3150 [Pseudomonadota bacterium]|jgi:vitamin B12 transporter
MFAFPWRPAAVCGLALSFLVPWHGHAAGPALLPDVVVTATRLPQALNQVLSDLRVVDSDTIRNAGAATLAELLQTHAGVEIRSNGGPGQTSAVLIRGTNANHVLALVDGVRINSATAGTTALENLPLAQIERIEVLRGAASSLYGADAIGGVVQIFTRRGERSEARIGLGSDATRDVSTGLGRRLGDTRVDLQAGYRETRAFSASNAGAGGFVFDPDDDRYRNTNLGGSIAHDWAPGHSVTLRGLASLGKVHFDSGPGGDDASRQRLASLALESRDQFGDAWTSLVRLARGTDDTRITGIFPSRFRTDQDQFSWQNDLKAIGGDLATGVEWRRERVDADTAYTQTQRRVGALFTSYAVAHDVHSGQLSVRHDDDSQFGGHTTGALGYGFKLAAGWRLSASAGTAFKAPSFADLYFPLTDFGVPGFPFLFGGNPGTRPERSRNLEAAVRFDDGAGWRAGGTLFRSRIRGLITPGPLPSDPSVNSVVNLDSAQIDGATFGAAFTAAAWRVQAEATHQRAVDAATRLPLLQRARNHATASAEWTPADWRAGIDWVGSGSRDDLDFNSGNRTRLGGYGLVHLHVGRRLTPELSVSARLNNIGDKRYELVNGFNTPGRNVYVALEYTAR